MTRKQVAERKQRMGRQAGAVDEEPSRPENSTGELALSDDDGSDDCLESEDELGYQNTSPPISEGCFHLPKDQAAQTNAITQPQQRSTDDWSKLTNTRLKIKPKAAREVVPKGPAEPEANTRPSAAKEEAKARLGKEPLTETPTRRIVIKAKGTWKAGGSRMLQINPNGEGPAEIFEVRQKSWARKAPADVRTGIRQSTTERSRAE